MKMTPMAMIRRRFSQSQSKSPTESNQTHDTEQNGECAIGVPVSVNKDLDDELRLIVNSQRRKEVLNSKLEYCFVKLDFQSTDKEEVKRREQKRQILLELVEFMNNLNQNKQNTSTILTEDMLKRMISMISSNIFQELSPQVDDFDPDEDDPILDPSWPHKQVIYEFLLRLIISPELSTKLAKKPGMFDQKFLINLLYLFQTEDSRERDYLKSILHRLYGKFFTHRKFMREQISYTFASVIDNNIIHNGIAELLEILGSIINGFSLPLKKEHLNFLKCSLLPLHKISYLFQFQQQLSYCITQFVEKDTNTAEYILKYLITIWPIISSQKQTIFLSEIEEILEALHPINTTKTNIYTLIPCVFTILARAINSHHFQVSERALFIWNNQTMSTNGLLSHIHAESVLPLVYFALKKNTEKDTRHWNETVAVLSERVLGVYKQGLGEDKFNTLIKEIVTKQEQQTLEREERSKFLYNKS